jgi:hypothetical protein
MLSAIANTISDPIIAKRGSGLLLRPTMKAKLVMTAEVAPKLNLER